MILQINMRQDNEQHKSRRCKKKKKLQAKQQSEKASTFSVIYYNHSVKFTFYRSVRSSQSRLAHHGLHSAATQSKVADGDRVPAGFPLGVHVTRSGQPKNPGERGCQTARHGTRMDPSRAPTPTPTSRFPPRWQTPQSEKTCNTTSPCCPSRSTSPHPTPCCVGQGRTNRPRRASSRRASRVTRDPELFRRPPIPRPQSGERAYGRGPKVQRASASRALGTVESSSGW